MKMNEARKDKMPIFAARFSVLRGERTQAEFAEFLGISRPTVGFYENGERIPDALVLKQIAERCGVTTDYLVGLSDNREAKNFDAGARFGLSDDAVKHLEYFKVEHTHKMKNHHFQGQALTPLDIFNRLLGEGDLQRICFLISALTLEKNAHVKNKQMVEQNIARIVDEKKRLDENYKPEEDIELFELRIGEYTEFDYFQYSCWRIFKEIEQLTNHILEQTFDIQLEESETNNADNPKTR